MRTQRWRRRRSARDRLLALTIAAAACTEPGADPHDLPTTAIDVELPALDACDDVRKWPASRRDREAELYAAITTTRELGGRCPDARRFAPTDALEPEGALVCAARHLAAELATSDSFGHLDGADGNVVDRLAAAGWKARLTTELVAAGDVDAEVVLDDVWLPSAPHCEAVFADAWTTVGVAVVERAVPAEPDPDAPMTWGAYWVVVLSGPAR